MILNPNLRHGESESIGVEESINMTIDTSDQAALMMILSENLYKDPIGSLVRESVSNALDAQKKAGNTDPIVVRLNQDKSYNYVFTVQDFGTGISPEEVRDVLSKYAASTKRDSNEYLGYYGLGFKAPLAYTDSFIFTTNWGGKMYKYMMYKGEEGTKIDLISEEVDTTNKNGTIVSVQLKNRADYQEFIDKIREQLAYFEGVYFGVASIVNDFKIIKSEDWKYSELTDESGMHICLGNVRYAIDWKRLGIPEIATPIGLNFDLNDGLLPVPSREDIKYTEEAKELIKVKIAAVADYFVKKSNEEAIGAKSFRDIYNKFSSHFVVLEGHVFDIKPLLKYSYITPEKPKLEGIKLLDLERLSLHTEQMFDIYEVRGRIYNKSFSGKYSDGPIDVFDKSSHGLYILAETPPKGVELEYLKVLHQYCKFFYKRYTRKLGKTNYVGWREERLSYRQLLNLEAYPRNQWRDIIKEYQSIEAEVLSIYPRLEDIKPTQEWLEERKANRKKTARVSIGDEQITLKIGRMAGRGDNNLVFDAQIAKIKTIGKVYKSLIVYGTNEEKEKLDNAARTVLMSKGRKLRMPRIHLVILNKYDIKKIKNLTNFITIDEFMKGKNKPFKVFATAILIHRLVEKESRIFNGRDLIEKLSESFAKKLEKLEKYKTVNFPTSHYEDSNFLDEVVRVAQENNLFDEKIIGIYNEINEKIHNFNFVKFFDRAKYEPDRTEVFELCKEILKGRGIRMNWKNYIKVSPTTPKVEEVEDPITDEVLAEATEIAKEEESEESFDLGFLHNPVGATLMSEEDE